jgi:hypothetical protein
MQQEDASTGDAVVISLSSLITLLKRRRSEQTNERMERGARRGLVGTFGGRRLDYAGACAITGEV